MEYRILGSLEVRSGSRTVALGGIKPRALLAVLLMHPNEPVHAERLALALWGEDAPASAAKTVQVYISRLRKAFDEPEILSTTPAGYRLRVRPDELDAERFAHLVEDGRRALNTGQAEEAGAALRDALALWRGPPLADFTFEAFAQAEIARLQEQRLAAMEERVEADLVAGQHATLVAELRQLVDANPTRERFAGQLMLALYRCGQQADALEAYHAARRVLAEIGVEPGPELRRLQEAILHQDPSLEPHAAVSELPQELDASTAPPLVGRVAELSWLRERWERARTGSGALLTVTGINGMGKSRVMAELARDAHCLAATVLYARGADSADKAFVALGRAREATRPTLLVVDDADQAEADVLAQIVELTRVLATMPVLALASGEDAKALAHLGADDSLALLPLNVDAVRTIAIRYAPGRAAEEVPVDWLLQASGGIPARVHELAGQWARREAVRRVGAVAGRAAAGRSELRSMESELADDIVALQAARERMVAGEVREALVVCPFKGLASFEVADAPYFFGRERLVAELVARLVGTPLLGVVGPSGSGKSSVLRAGLLPALAGGVLPSSARWTQVLVRPGEHPLRELSAAVPPLEDDRRSVLAVDQFEETFTACRDEQERAAFIAELVRIAQVRDERCVVVLAIRADYYGRCAAYPELASLLAPNHVLVGPMRRDELFRVVQCPAQRVGLSVEPELADALVADVEDELGGLPLLSAALLELWQRREGWNLRHTAYQHTGGVHGAVSRLAEEAFSQLDAGEQIAARKVLMRLVAAGADDAVERRRLPLAEFGTERSRDVPSIVSLLADRRLLTISTGTVEVAHEALLREWPRLRTWIEENREGLRIQRRLTAAAEEWRRLGEDKEALYRGARLTETVEWRDTHGPSLNELEREFLAASEAGRARDHAARRRRRRLTGAVAATLAAAVVAIVVSVLFAGRERDIAASRDLATKASTLIATDPGLALAIAFEALRRSDTEQAQSALRQASLANQATRVVTAHRSLVYGFALSPNGRLAATASADRTVRIWSLSSGRRVGEIHGYANWVRAVSFSRDSKRIASASDDGEIAVAAADGGRRHVIARLKGDFAYGIDFGVEGKTLAIGTSGGRVAIVSLDNGAVHDMGPRSTGSVFSVSFDDVGRRLVSAGADGFARIWKVAGGRPLKLAHGKNTVIAASFSPDGSRLATVDFSGAMGLWSTSNGRPAMRKMHISDHELASVCFSGNGRRVVIGARDGVLHVVAIRERSVLARLTGHHGPARAMFIPRSNALVSAGEEDGTLRTWIPPATRVPARSGTAPLFSGDTKGRNQLVVSGDDRGPVHVWNPATGEDREFTGHTEASSPQFSPDGTHIVSASWDGRVLLWDVKSGRPHTVPSLPGEKYAAAIDARGKRIAIGGATPLVVQAPDGSGRRRLLGQHSFVNALVFSPNGRHLLTGSDDGTARIWNARSGTLERTLRMYDAAVRGVSYSQDGQKIATASSDGAVRVWPAKGGNPVILVGHAGGVNTARFDDPGDRLVSAGDDGTIRIWDARGGEDLLVLYQHKGTASGADFSSDGHSVVSAGDDGMRITACEVCGTLEAAVHVARTRAQHTLSTAERERLLPGG